MRTVRRTAAVTALALSLSACGLGGAGPLDGLLEQTREQVEGQLDRFGWCAAAFRLATAVSAGDLDGIQEAADELRDGIPQGLEDELATITDAVRRAQAEGGVEALQDEATLDAARAVLDAVREACGLGGGDAG